jgi:hypothetical protein
VTTSAAPSSCFASLIAAKTFAPFRKSFEILSGSESISFFAFITAVRSALSTYKRIYRLNLPQFKVKPNNK